jgi:hypothetical protein
VNVAVLFKCVVAQFIGRRSGDRPHLFPLKTPDKSDNCNFPMAAPRLRSISFFRPSFFFAVFALPVFPLFAQGPTYVHIPSFVNEYELDRLMSETPWDWRDLFRSVPTGFQASANSLNIRHLLVEETLKARFPLGDRWSFRVRHLQTHVLERRETATEVEFEYSPLSRWYFSFFGEPTFHKADATAGLAARWGLDEGRSIRLAYAWPRFDANYAFENRSVNEGYQEFYRRFPQEARLQAAWIPGACLPDGAVQPAMGTGPH